MNSARMLSFVVIPFVLLGSAVSMAVVPSEIGFQGRLVDSAGGIPPDDNYEITFSLWDDPTAGSQLWSETQQVEVIDGRFDVELGSQTDIPVEELSLNYEKIYLQTQVLGDSPMMPRIPLNSVPYSLVSSRIQGDVFTGPGSIRINEVPPINYAELSGTEIEAKLSLGGQEGEEIVSLSADDQGSGLFMVDSFFDVQYRIQLETFGGQGHMDISNIGSSGEDGVSIDVTSLGSNLELENGGLEFSSIGRLGVDDNAATCGIEHEEIGGATALVNSTADATGGHLVISNIGSSGEDGVSIDVGGGNSFIGIEHEDIGDEQSSALSMAGATGSRHEVAHNLSIDQSSAAGIKADGSGAGLFAVDSFFDVYYRIDHHASDSGSYFGLSADDGISMFKRADKATPNLYQATCSGSHENGQSLLAKAINNQGSSGEYRWIPEVGDEILVGLHAGSAGGHLTVSNIGSSGEDGVSLLSNATHSMLSIREGGNNTVQLSSDGTTDQLSLGDLDGEGRLDLVAGSSSGDISVFFQDSFGNSGVSLGSAGGDGGGGRLALVNQAVGDPVPIEIVALSLVSTEPIVVARNPDYSPTDPPVLEFDYDALDRLTMTLRDSEAAPGESTKTSTDGFHLYEGPSEFHLDTRGLFFSDPTGPVFSVSPLGEMNLRGGGVLASDPATTLGIGFPSPGFKLAVDGDVCVTGTYLSCSDIRYKKNITEIENGLDLISRIRGVRFDWNTEEFSDKQFSNDRQVGLIAQEVEEVIPEVVTKDDNGYYAVDYARLAPILIEAVKEQQAKIRILEQKIEENDQLRTEIEKLKELVHSMASNREKAEGMVLTEAKDL
jgi:type VI protein secretion system component Hcp